MREPRIGEGGGDEEDVRLVVRTMLYSRKTLRRAVFSWRAFAREREPGILPGGAAELMQCGMEGRWSGPET